VPSVKSVVQLFSLRPRPSLPANALATADVPARRVGLVALQPSAFPSICAKRTQTPFMQPIMLRLLNENHPFLGPSKSRPAISHRVAPSSSQSK
jgi:hypothetical protein